MRPLVINQTADINDFDGSALLPGRRSQSLDVEPVMQHLDLIFRKAVRHKHLFLKIGKSDDAICLLDNPLQIRLPISNRFEVAPETRLLLTEDARTRT